MLFSTNIKRKLIGLDGRIELIEKQLEQAACVHELKDRMFVLSYTNYYIEKCGCCQKTLQTFTDKSDWNKGRIDYMKARIEELKGEIKRQGGAL